MGAARYIHSIDHWHSLSRSMAAVLGGDPLYSLGSYDGKDWKAQDPKKEGSIEVIGRHRQRLFIPGVPEDLKKEIRNGCDRYRRCSALDV